MKRELPLICLSGSGGGHVRQLLDLAPLWGEFPHFFVTEDTILGRSIGRSDEVEYVPHFALGQARMGKGLGMLFQAWKSFWASGAIMLRRKPDIVICTGAGSQTFVLFWARAIGAQVVLIDSFARFHKPSKFARLTGWLAHVRIAQSADSGRQWKGAKVFDPLRVVHTPAPPKQPLVLATVGAILPFDRLTDLVLDAKRKGLIPERLIMQVGHCEHPIEAVEGVDIVPEMPFHQLLELLANAEVVICHGGTGSLVTALSNHCKVIAIPRRTEMGDAYDNHQLEITEAFASRGLIEIAEDAESLEQALKAARTRQPVAIRMEHSALIAFLRARIRESFPGVPQPEVQAETQGI